MAAMSMHTGHENRSIIEEGVFWNSIKPVDTELSDVNVVGCKPPWYLW